MGADNHISDPGSTPSTLAGRAASDGKWKLHVYPKINHRLLFDLSTDPHEMTNLATAPAHGADAERMQALMESWRTRLGDPYPLSVEKPEPKEPEYDNSKRVLDVWQPKWIRDKYFGGRDDPNHGKGVLRAQKQN